MDLRDFIVVVLLIILIVLIICVSIPGKKSDHPNPQKNSEHTPKPKMKVVFNDNLEIIPQKEPEITNIVKNTPTQEDFKEKVYEKNMSKNNLNQSVTQGINDLFNNISNQNQESDNTYRRVKGMHGSAVRNTRKFGI